MKNLVPILFVGLLSMNAAADDPRALVASEPPFDAERWMTFYYEHPEPEKAFDAIRSIHDDGLLLLPDSQRSLLGFFSTIFRDNDAITTQVLARSPFLTQEEIGVLAYAFWFADTDDARTQLKALSDKDSNFKPFLNSAPPSILESPLSIPNSIDMCWGHFFASGDTAYVRKIIQTLDYADEMTDLAKILVYGSARWSLASNCRRHTTVLNYCRSTVSGLSGTQKIEVQSILDEIDGKISPAAATKQQ